MSNQDQKNNSTMAMSLASPLTAALSTDLLYSNKFVPIPFISSSNGSAEAKRRAEQSFREYYEKTHGKPLYADYNLTSSSLFDPTSSSRFLSSGSTGRNLQLSNAASQPPEQNIKVRTQIVTIDSKDRDVNLYPDPNNYRIYLSNRFTNVTKVRMVSSEFPNTEQLIKSQSVTKKNNKIYWRNDPNTQPDGDVTYSVTITDGNYNASSFASELKNKLNVVQREITGETGVYSNFNVSVDNTRNTFTLRQNNNFNLNNPISVTAGSNVVTVAQDNHNFLPGQIVNITGSNGVGGVPSAAINASQVINVTLLHIENLYRSSGGTNTATTNVIFGTSGTPLQGQVNTESGAMLVTGKGTKFSTLAAGNVLSIGYGCYTIDKIVDDFTLTVEEPLKENFTGFTFIKSLSQPYAFDVSTNPANSNVYVLNNKLRNINYTSQTEYTMDQSYEATHNDMSLKIYQLIQPTLSIFNFDKSFSLPVTFLQRDPTYENFQKFVVGASIDNFNVLSFSSQDNTFRIKFGSSVESNITFPSGAENILQTVSTLNSLMVGWTILYDTVTHLLYFRPPIGLTQNFAFQSISTLYRTYRRLSLDFTSNSSLNQQSVSALLGFAPGLFNGTTIVSTSNVLSTGGGFTIDPSLASLTVIDVNNNTVGTLNLIKRQYNSVLDLVSQLKTSLLQSSIPLQVSYSSGLSRVIFMPYDLSKTYKIVFSQGIATLPYVSLSSVLGFDSTYIHENVNVVSVLPIKHILTEAYYSHQYLDTINSVPFYKSIRSRGIAQVTNNSSIVTGSYDMFYMPINGTLVNPSGSLTTTIVGNVSGVEMTQTSGPATPGAANIVGYTYFTRTGQEPEFDLSSFSANNKDVKYFAVSLGIDGRFAFTSADGVTTTSLTAFEVVKGSTYVFDLRTLTSTSRFKLSTQSNGANAGGTEFSAPSTSDGSRPLIYRQYLSTGQLMLLHVPVSDNNLKVLYYYDDLSADPISTAGGDSTLTKVFYFKMNDMGYITISEESTVNVDLLSLTYQQTPILNLSIGNTYLLNYSQVTSQVGYSSEQLKLALTVDGTHYFGQELKTASYISYPALYPNTIQLQLTDSNMPFPPNLYYYLADTKGACGDGYITISFEPHCGAMPVLNPYTTYYTPFLQGPVVAAVQNSSYFNGTTIIAPYHNINSVSSSTFVSATLYDTIGQNASNIITYPVANVTEDNRYFVLEDITGANQYVIALSTGSVGLPDLAVNLSSAINQALSLSDPGLMWDVIADTTDNLLTFLVRNGRIYRFIFQDDLVTLPGVLLYNSSADLLGFSQADPPPSNIVTIDLITSTYAVDLSGNTSHAFGVTTASLPTTLSNKMIFTESIVSSTDSSKTALILGSAKVLSGTKFLSDFTVGDSVLLGEDLDAVFTISSIVSDTLMNLDQPAIFIASTTDQYGTVIAAPSTVFRVFLYRFTGLDANALINGENFIFFRTSQAQSVYDYDGKLTKRQLTLTRVSPIKLSIFDSNTLLEAAALDVSNVYNYNSIQNTDIRFVKNNSRYFFTTQYPATSNVTARGGNPVSVGTGIKFSLLFSNTDTPGNLLGFPDVGIPSGDTTYKTVQSNTTINSSHEFNIERTEAGVGSHSGSLRVITSSEHNFEYGDTVFIENHTGSSNDLAVNNDEGWTITLYQDDRTVLEYENGTAVTRGVFYISLNLSYGGAGGICYTKKLYKPFTLSGDNYVFLTCPQLASVATTSAKIENVFAKILLNAPPGAILFNAHISSDKTFDDQPLPVLEYLDFAVYDTNGELFDFNNINNSLSIEISYKSIETESIRDGSTKRQHAVTNCTCTCMKLFMLSLNVDFRMLSIRLESCCDDSRMRIIIGHCLVETSRTHHCFFSIELVNTFKTLITFPVL